MAMTKQEQNLLNQLDGAYTAKRRDEMIKLQNKLTKEITNARLPSQDILMVLVVLQRSIETVYMGRLAPKKPEKEE
ncbi:hypothetical protein LCGC14_2181350 [marine sediment metagenome]|uniref:Uncharacterized protein n=1 Tax=marine sediment metagenome TaxID=412755 RepID=A0A0F9DM87_9ZZZZ